MQDYESELFRNTIGEVSLFNIAEYVYSLSKATGVSIQFEDLPKDLGAEAMVDVHSKVIYLPRLDNTRKFDYKQFYKIKAFLIHECAHLLYPDPSYTTKNDMSPDHKDFKLVISIARMLDDLRIETQLGREYQGIKEDFKSLIDQIWREDIEKLIVKFNKGELEPELQDGHGLWGDFSGDLMGSFYWQIQKQYRKASLSCDGETDIEFKPVSDFVEFFDDKLVPVINRYIDNTKVTTLQAAKDVLYILKEHYPHVFDSLPTPTPSEDGESEPFEDSDKAPGE